MNALITHSTSTEQFATFFLCQVEEKALRMRFSNAGHNYPVLFKKSGERMFLEKGGIVMGMMDAARFEEDHVDLDPGDRVVFFTDGINEAMNRNGDEYTEERLWDLTQSLPAELTSREMTEHILADLHEFLDGEEPQDDVTLMILRVLETSPAEVSAGL
jgi:sigma-B regulation protein RsbU (phosphoserine phosphatase)